MKTTSVRDVRTAPIRRTPICEVLSKAWLALSALQFTLFPTSLFIRKSSVALQFIYKNAPVAEVPHSCTCTCASLSILKYESMNDHSGDKEVSPGRESGTDDAELVRALVGSHDGGEIGSPKEAGVVFQSLSVTVPDGDAVYVKTLPRAIMNTFGVDQFNFLRGLLFSARAPASSTAKTKHILSDITGLVKPGEMLFVLGRPGSGCSTLLRTLANRSKLSVSGDLHYSGISSAQFSKTHSRETIYMPEEDRHIASLNVRQTIEFALRMALPNSMRSKGSVEELCVVIARMFGLEHALQTPVGGAFFPGVSGGERKRYVLEAVSLAIFD